MESEWRGQELGFTAKVGGREANTTPPSTIAFRRNITTRGPRLFKATGYSYLHCKAPSVLCSPTSTARLLPSCAIFGHAFSPSASGNKRYA
jgi:hypothetical protein